ncbi:MAG: hypothetical protein VW683_01415 [Betaproteobacteria bacterium]|jgi:hypothetical protein
MKKAVVENFIQKYSLGGAIDSVNWHVENGTLSVTGTPQDTQVISFVDTDALDLSDGTYSIYDTTQLRSFLNVMGGDINLDVVTNGSRPISFKMDDKPSGGRTKIQFVLSDPNVIPKESKEADLGDFDVGMDINKDFMTRFIRSKSALSDLNVFTVVTDEDENTSFILGYDSNMLTSQIQMEVETDGGLELPRTFSANYLKEIFAANKDCERGRIEIHERSEMVGVMKVSFEHDDYNVRYYLLQINKQAM